VALNTIKQTKQIALLLIEGKKRLNKYFITPLSLLHEIGLIEKAIYHTGYKTDESDRKSYGSRW
jgi:hypothetical protein